MFSSGGTEIRGTSSRDLEYLKVERFYGSKKLEFKMKIVKTEMVPEKFTAWKGYQI